MNILLTVGFAAAIFLAMILQLAGKPKITSKITGVLLVFSAVCGLWFYGYGFSQLVESVPLAIMRTLWAVIGMFMGRNEISALTALPYFQHPVCQVLLWLAHVAAIYTLASAAITTVGARALQALRLMIARKGDLILVYGSRSECADFAVSCSKQKGVSVVCVPASAGANTAPLSSAGIAFRRDSAALHPTKGFLRSLGIRPGRRKLQICCLDEDSGKNFTYAKELLAAMEQRGISASQTTLTIVDDGDSAARRLQVTPEHYGYGFVNAFRSCDQVARLLINCCPPCDTVEFLPDCRAAGDFTALIIGFGQIGQSVLRYLTMSSQFAGSRYSVTVMAPDLKNQAGLMKAENPALFSQYDIHFLNDDARSEALFQWISENRASLRYVAVCVPNDRLSHEITGDVLNYCKTLGLCPAVAQCSSRGVTCYRDPTQNPFRKTLFSAESLLSGEQDSRAVELNHTYCRAAGNTAWEDWVNCDEFSRMSSRASADFAPALRRAAGLSEKTGEKQAALTEEQLTVLGETEHLRWCAFHFCSGFEPMSEDELHRRAEQYRQEKAETGSSRVRICKNMQARTHACLIPWEELDALSEYENSVTGGSLDYKQMDIQNVETILAMKEGEK